MHPAKPEARPDTSPACHVGHFQSIPWIPFYAGAAAWPAELIPCESSSVVLLAQAGGLDITPMATVDWLSRRAQWKRLGAYGLAYRDKAGSVLLFSHVPIDALDGVDIAVCAETMTSVRVLAAILDGKYGLRRGTWRRSLDPADRHTPRLLIQDAALQEARRGEFPYVYDIGREWWTWQHTPIVSAVWACRRDLAPEIVDAMRARLDRSLADYARDPDAIIREHLHHYRVDIASDTISNLLGHFEFTLGAEAEQGIARMAEVLPQRLMLDA